MHCIFKLYPLFSSCFSWFKAQVVEKAAREANFQCKCVRKPEHKNNLYTLAYSGFPAPKTIAVQELTEQNKQQQATIIILLKQVELLTIKSAKK
ncbi:MAG: hypothetical protein DRJ05_15020 [Bacteroidetes bacterium]|nr:MAG: hypothetical protein DRJ05_15020 [Bacteroidota bacterium]